MERYDYLYSARELKPWVERTREMAEHPGVANAMMLQAMLTGRKVHAPEALVREYRDTLGPYVLPPEEEAPRARWGEVR